MSVGVCAYSFNTGYDAFQLMDMAVQHGLGGVEFPPDDCLPDLSPASLERARTRAEERGCSSWRTAARSRVRCCGA